MIKKIAIAIGVLAMLYAARGGIPSIHFAFALLISGAIVGGMAYGLMKLISKLD